MINPSASYEEVYGDGYHGEEDEPTPFHGETLNDYLSRCNEWRLSRWNDWLHQQDASLNHFETE